MPKASRTRSQGDASHRHRAISRASAPTPTPAWTPQQRVKFHLEEASVHLQAANQASQEISLLSQGKGQPLWLQYREDLGNALKRLYRLAELASKSSSSS